MQTSNAMTRSITWGAIVGVVLGATVTVALSRGWLEMPWRSARASDIASPVLLDDTAPGATDEPASYARPLRPGGLRVGDLATSLPRS